MVRKITKSNIGQGYIGSDGQGKNVIKSQPPPASRSNNEKSGGLANLNAGQLEGIEEIKLRGYQKAGIKQVGGSDLKSRLIGDEMRCVSGNTKININRGGKGFTTSIWNAYHCLRTGAWDNKIPTKIRSLVNGEIRLQEIQEIHDIGAKWLLKISTEEDKVLYVTKDHKIATPLGWRLAGDLSINDELLTNGYEIDECSQCGSNKEIIKYKYAKFRGWCKQCMYRYGRDNDSRGLGGRSIDADGYVRISGQYDHPRRQGTASQVKEHELVMEEYLGRYLLWPDEHVHHKDHNRQNNDISNLELKSPNAHGKEHGNYGRFPLAQPKKERIVGIESAGIWPAFDITMAGDHPNFVANGIIVHNCGKTPTAIGIDWRLRSEVERRARGNNCSLIVCPKSVIDHWADVLLRMGVPSGEIFTIDLPSKQALRKVLGHIARDKRKADAKPYRVIINWDAVQTVKKELLNAGPWFHIIGDEIHRIKGRDTKRTESFKRIKAKQRTGLSGTPADNRPEDFWSVLNWLQPQSYSSYWSFVDRYCKVEETRQGYKKIVGVREENLPELREQMAPYYIRRKLRDVAEWVPQKQYRTIYVDMGAKQRREYDELQDEMMADIDGGMLVTGLAITQRVRLQQMAIGCCKGEWIKRKKWDDELGKYVEEDYLDTHITDNPKSPKLDAVMELIQDEPELGPFIVLAQHHDTVRLLNSRFQNVSRLTATITGNTPIAERSQAVANFQSGRADVFTGTIGACREGITLSRGQTIIFVDIAWNPNWNRQAEARADDLNSDLPVTIIHIETRNSIDQDRRLRILQKGEDTDAITRTT